jgi:hypothetical protein
VTGPTGPTGPAATAVHQVGHGFAVKDVVRLSGASTYTKAQANSAANSEAVGIVSAVAGADDFTFVHNAYISGLSGLTAGEVHFLSPSSAGALTTTDPTTAGQISKPILVADSTTSGFVLVMRGVLVTNAATDFTQAFLMMGA